MVPSVAPPSCSSNRATEPRAIRAESLTEGSDRRRSATRTLTARSHLAFAEGKVQNVFTDHGFLTSAKQITAVSVSVSVSMGLLVHVF
jgi:hypothetical protein